MAFTAEQMGDLLARFNAGLNLTSLLLLLTGFFFIRRGQVARHRACMIGAVTASVLFLVFYVTRFSLTGTHSFAGEGSARTIYLSVLFTHMVLAVVIVPLILRLLYLASRERFEEHKRWARWTFPIWVYVSATGLLVYAMLYHVYGFTV